MSNIFETEKLEVPDIPGIGYYYFQRMTEHVKNNKIAQIDGHTGEEETFESLLKRSIRTALFLRDKGIKKEDVVCLFGPNDLNSCVPYIACHFIGAIPTCINITLSKPDIKHLISIVKPKIFFSMPEYIDLIQNLLTELGLQADFVTFGDSELHSKFSDIMKPHKNEDTFTPIEIKDTKETAILYFSSGTSGLPKAVCVNHYSMLCQVCAPRETENPDVEAMKANMSKIHNDRFVSLIYSTMYWIGGGVNLLTGTCHGTVRIVCKYYESSKIWYLIDKYKVNFMMSSPWVAKDMGESQIPENMDASSLIAMLVTGSRAPLEVILTLRKRLPGTIVYQGYAQTELAGSNLYFDTNDKVHRKYIRDKPDSVGVPGKGMIYKVVDTETNEPLGPNQEGELRVKGQTMMNGYYNMDSSDNFDEEGFYKTGDIVYYDNEKCFYVVDRIKEIFKYKNIHISPFLIQEVVLKHPAVKEAAVFGYPHPEDQYHAVAVVVLNENATATAEEIKEFVDSRVDDNKKLRGGVKIIKSLPMTPTGKVKVRDLKVMMDKNLI